MFIKILKKMFKHSKGFSLLEISIVIIIMGLLLVASFESTKFFLLQNFIKTTNIKLNAIELALESYVIKNGHLPCPSNLKGDTGESASSCHSTNLDGDLFVFNGVARGGVPFQTLDLIPDLAYDAWNGKIIYSVSVETTRDLKRMQDGNFSSITIYDNNLTDKITSEAIYSLASNGPNKFGSFDYKKNHFLSSNGISLLERKNLGNSDSDKNVYFSSYKTYDDFIRYKTRMQLFIKTGLEDLYCCANSSIVSNLAISNNVPQEDIRNLIFPISTVNFCTYLNYNERIKNTDINTKYEIRCFKYGRLGLYKYE